MANAGEVLTLWLGLIVGVIVVVVVITIALGKREDGDEGSLNRYMVPRDVEDVVDIIEPGCVVTNVKVDPMGRFELCSRGRHGPSRIRAYREGEITIGATAPESARLRRGASFAVLPGNVSLPDGADQIDTAISGILAEAVRNILAASGLEEDTAGTPELTVTTEASFETAISIRDAQTAGDSEAEGTRAPDGPGSDAPPLGESRSLPAVGRASITLTMTDDQTGERLWRGVLLNERARAIDADMDELKRRAHAAIEYALALLPVGD